MVWLNSRLKVRWVIEGGRLMDRGRSKEGPKVKWVGEEGMDDGESTTTFLGEIVVTCLPLGTLI